MTRSTQMDREKKRLWSQIADNYVFHFECRQHVKGLDPAQVQHYLMYALQLETLKLNRWGALDISMDVIDWMIKRAKDNKFPDAWLLIPFYLSDAGWDEFQRQWCQKVPDFIHNQTVERLWRRCGENPDVLAEIRIPVEFSTTSRVLSTGTP